MLSQVETSTTWLHDANANGWTDDLSQLSLDKSVLFGAGGAGGLLDKVNDDKLARDVEDLSAIFEELEGGVVDFPLPCDEEDVATGAEVTGDWIGDLETDVVNVEELSTMFDVLAAEQAGASTVCEGDVKEAESASENSSSDDEDVSMDESDGDYDDEDADECDGDARAISVQIIPAPPTWASSAPLDPRSVIRTPVFKNLDSRIPRIDIPRIDLRFGAPCAAAAVPTGVVRLPRKVTAVSPKACEDKTKTAEYRHDPASCWICKSDKSAYKKYALHRYLEKRHRRNWKRGPRYSGRSNVATNRVREGGRFVTTAHWI